MSDQADQSKHHRAIRSYVIREGRITVGQQRALDELLPNLQISEQGDIDFAEEFGREAAVWLEVGFGNGESLAAMATANPQVDFVGIEVHRSGVGHLLLAVEELQLTNVRVICGDAMPVLQQRITAASLARVNLYFPDPWPKKKHHKRRILNQGFLDLIAPLLQPEGVFHYASDWQEYAEEALAFINGHEQFSNSSENGDFSPRPEERPITKFERRGQRLGHGVWDVLCTRNSTNL